MHTLHGDIHEIGLQDDCPTCEEHANNPLRDLDSVMLANLLKRNWYFRFEKNVSSYARVDNSPRSYTEASAMAQITNMMEKCGKLFEVDASTMADYLEQRWHINFNN